MINSYRWWALWQSRNGDENDSVSKDNDGAMLCVTSSIGTQQAPYEEEL